MRAPGGNTPAPGRWGHEAPGPGGPSPRPAPRAAFPAGKRIGFQVGGYPVRRGPLRSAKAGGYAVPVIFMKQTLRIAAFALAALMALPPAGAIWKVQGTYEPDTHQDAADGWMFTDAPTQAEERVYFNVIQTYYFTGVNPNTGAVAGGRLFDGNINMDAWLGTWRDCNKDGYIGMALSAETVYPLAEANAIGQPVDSSICPVQARDPASPTFGGTNELVHNDGQWVREFIPIGPGDGFNQGAHDFAFLNDTEAGIWGDNCTPDQNCPVTTCPLVLGYAPATFSSTGGFIAFADCLDSRFTGFRVVTSGVNDVADALDAAGLHDQADAVRITDPVNAGSSGSIVNQHFPVSVWGDPYAGDGEQGGALVNGGVGVAPVDDQVHGVQNPFSGGTQDGQRTGLLQENSEKNHADGTHDDRDAAFTTWDCAGDDTANQASPVGETKLTPDDDPTGGVLIGGDGILFGQNGFTVWDGQPVRVPAAAPTLPYTVPHGSVYDGANETFAMCTTQNRAPLPFAFGNDGLNLGLQSAMSPDRNGTAAEPAKRSNDWYFTFVANGGQNALLTQGIPGAGIPGVGGRGMPGSGEAQAGLDSSPWQFTNGGVLNRPRVIRNDFATNPSTQPLPNAVYYTFYAKLGRTAGLSLPHAGSGVYGAESCQGDFDNVVNGWDCNPDHWFDTAYGGSASPTDNWGRPVGVHVGTEYQLRDTDCYDGRVANDVPVGDDAAALGPNACPTDLWS